MTPTPLTRSRHAASRAAVAAFALTLPLAAAAQPSATKLPARAHAETFRYETVREGDTERVRQELVTMWFEFSTNAVVTRYLSEREDGTEDVTIRTTAGGRLIAATREDRASDGRSWGSYRIWTDSNAVYVAHTKLSGRESVSSRALDHRELVADAGLLGRMRTFPFDTDQELVLRLAAFSQHFVTITVRQEGEETVCVPAGEFDCWKLDAVVDLVITSIRTTYWVSKEPPHFLVKFRGRRGILLAPTYTTSLLSFSTNQPPAAAAAPANVPPRGADRGQPQ